MILGTNNGIYYDARYITAVSLPQQKLLNVYPNPSSAQIFLPNELLYKKIELKNIAGQLIREMNIASVLDISFLSPGIYILSITDIAGNSYYTKVVKN